MVLAQSWCQGKRLCGVHNTPRVFGMPKALAHFMMCTNSLMLLSCMRWNLMDAMLICVYTSTGNCNTMRPVKASAESHKLWSFYVAHTACSP